MTVIELKFVPELPPPAKYRPHRSSKVMGELWDHAAAELQGRPGEWAELRFVEAKRTDYARDMLQKRVMRHGVISCVRRQSRLYAQFEPYGTRS